MEGRKNPHLLTVSDSGLVFNCVLLLVFVVGSCDGRKRVFKVGTVGGGGEWSVNIVGFVFCDDAVLGNVDISTIKTIEKTSDHGFVILVPKLPYPEIFRLI